MVRWESSVPSFCSLSFFLSWLFLSCLWQSMYLLFPTLYFFLVKLLCTITYWLSMGKADVVFPELSPTANTLLHLSKSWNLSGKHWKTNGWLHIFESWMHI
jgi:hypothetical protein